LRNSPGIKAEGKKIHGPDREWQEKRESGCLKMPRRPEEIATPASVKTKNSRQNQKRLRSGVPSAFRPRLKKRGVARRFHGQSTPTSKLREKKTSKGSRSSRRNRKKPQKVSSNRKGKPKKRICRCQRERGEHVPTSSETYRGAVALSRRGSSRAERTCQHSGTKSSDNKGKSASLSVVGGKSRRHQLEILKQACLTTPLYDDEGETGPRGSAAWGGAKKTKDLATA